MLVALTNQNERFVLRTSIPKTTLFQLRKTTQFFCPQCKEQLQLKIGTIKIPHFAHLSKSNCEGHFSEGESEQHLLGKEQLFQMFQRLHMHVELEPFIQKLQQRPDLLITTEKGNLFAIEYQCSSISSEQLSARNSGYLSERITPIWIPSSPSKEVHLGISKISLPFQLQQFIQSTTNQQYLITYNPYSEQFYYFSNLVYINGNRFLAKVLNLPLKNQYFPLLEPKFLSKEEFSHYLLIYHSSIVKYLHSRVLISRKGVNDLFLRSIYELRLRNESLPIFIGIPLQGNESVKEMSVEWQTAFFYFLQLHGYAIQNVNKEMIRYFLKWAKLNESEKAVSVVGRYCFVLRELNIQHCHSPIKSEQLKDVLYSQFLASGVKN